MLEHELFTRPGPQDRLLLLVHGYAESPSPMTDRLERIDPEGRYVAVVPRAPFVHKGKDIWHRALFGESSDPFEQFRQSLALLGDLVDGVCSAEGFDPAEAVFGGFSQGAGLALGLSVAVAARPRPAGCLAFCGFVPPIAGLPVSRARIAGMRMALFSSFDDEFIPAETSRQSAAVLTELGLDVTFRELHSGHRVTDESADLAGAWLAGEAIGQPVEALDPTGLWDLVRTMWDLHD